jgi:hypothetical protein
VPERLDRRDFLARIVGAGLSCAGAALNAGCSGGPTDEELAAEARRLSAGLTCTDTGGLQEAEVRTRTTNEYVERSATEGQFCFNCDNYQRPQAAGRCATCRTVRGPINPGGWCTAWTRSRA